MGTYTTAGFWRVINVKQYELLGGHDEITATIIELEKAEVIRPAQCPFGSRVGL